MNFGYNRKTVVKLTLIVFFILCTGRLFGHNNTSPCIIQLKFHKVASATVAESLKPFGDEWLKKSHFCGFSPYHAHHTLRLYRSFSDLYEIKDICVNQTIASCDKLEATTVLRNPMERLTSQLYAFHEKLQKFTVKSDLSIKKTVRSLTSRTKSITPIEMRILLETIQSFQKIDSFDESYDDVNFHEYFWTLGKIKIKTSYIDEKNETVYRLDQAKKNMRGIKPIGLMEHMPSYFMLLHWLYNATVENTCNLKVDHGIQRVYLKHFNRATRPPVEELFQSKTIEVIRDFVRLETELWKEGFIVHQEQLSWFNHTIDTATNEWMYICGRRKLRHFRRWYFSF